MRPCTPFFIPPQISPSFFRRKGDTSTTATKQKKLWRKVSEGSRMQLRPDLLNLGILIIRPETLEEKNNHTSENKFSLNTRNYEVTQVKDVPMRRLNRYLSLLSMIVNKSKERDYSLSCITDGVIIRNTMRRDEMFCPVRTSEDIGFYLYPWASSLKIEQEFAKKPFLGFKKYAGVCCMFGSALSAADTLGWEYPIIKHDIEFGSDQKINNIIFHSGKLNAYEMTFFFELGRLALFIKASSFDTKNPSLTLHLPYYDYLLFVLKLFLYNRITLDALNHFSEILQDRVRFYMAEIKKRFAGFDIRVDIVSPFDNAFGEVIFSDECPMTELFKKLEPLPSDIKAKLVSDEPINDPTEMETVLVKKIMFLLKTNTIFSSQQIVWRETLSAIDDKKIASFEDLFKLGNAIVLGFVSREEEPCQVCSFLPVSEKQIQVTYDQQLRSNSGGTYPPVFNMTALDAIIGYTYANQAVPMFYVPEKYVSEKRIPEMLRAASKNIGTIPEKKQDTSIAEQQDPLPDTEESGAMDRETISRQITR